MPSGTSQPSYAFARQPYVPKGLDEAALEKSRSHDQLVAEQLTPAGQKRMKEERKQTFQKRDQLQKEAAVRRAAEEEGGEGQRHHARRIARPRGVRCRCTFRS